MKYSTVLLFAVFLAAPQGTRSETLTYSTGDFMDTEWSSVIGGTGTSVATTESTGGNPGAYRKVSLTVAPFQSVANRQLWSVAKYTPARQGPVASVSLSYELTRVFTNNSGATQIVKGIAVQQGGVVYTLIQGVAIVAPPNWDSFSVADLVPLFPAVNWKDGTEITFGFLNSVSTSDIGFTIAGGYDNFAVTINYTPLSPLIQFRFEEGSGTTVSSTGSVAGVSGTLQEGKNAGNGPRFSTDTPQGIGSTYSLQFDGINNMVRMMDVFDYTMDGRHSGAPLTQMTIEAWIKPSNVSGLLQRTIWDDYGNPGVYFALAGDLVQLSISTASNPGMGISNVSGKITPGVWQHVAAVYDGQQIKVYVDGQQTESVVPTSGAIQDNSSVNPAASFIAIGADSQAIPALNFAGLIDDVRVYGIALTRGQLAGGFFANRPATQCQIPVIPEKGAKSLITGGDQLDISVGYARVQPTGNSAAPAALAAFGLQQNDVLVTEATVPASALVRSGRFPAFITQSLNAGIAIANPFSQEATLNYYFTDSNGNLVKEGSTPVPAYSQISQFLTDPPISGNTPASGTFSFSSTSPVAAVALRGLWNEQNDFLLTTLPMAGTTATDTGPVVIPHYADGGGWTTDIFLVNPSDSIITGKLQFYNQGTQTQNAQPISMNVDGTTDTLFGYSVPARSANRLRTSGENGSTRAGSVLVTPDNGNASPTAMVVFSMKQNGVTKTEAGVLSSKPTAAVRMYVEASGVLGDPNSIQSGVAVSNPSQDPISVLFELTTVNGQATGVSKSFPIAGRGQISMFLSGINGFESLTMPFKGVLRISTTSTAGIVVTGLRCRYNEKSEFLITTTAAADEYSTVSTAETLFPQIVDSGGYRTQFVWFSNVPGQAHTICVRYLSKSGAPLNWNIR